jgi:hypothetical protein
LAKRDSAGSGKVAESNTGAQAVTKAVADAIACKMLPSAVSDDYLLSDITTLAEETSHDNGPSGHCQWQLPEALPPEFQKMDPLSADFVIRPQLSEKTKHIVNPPKTSSKISNQTEERVDADSSDGRHEVSEGTTQREIKKSVSGAAPTLRVILEDKMGFDSSGDILETGQFNTFGTSATSDEPILFPIWLPSQKAKLQEPIAAEAGSEANSSHETGDGASLISVWNASAAQRRADHCMMQKKIADVTRVLKDLTANERNRKCERLVESSASQTSPLELPSCVMEEKQVDGGSAVTKDKVQKGSFFDTVLANVHPGC